MNVDRVKGGPPPSVTSADQRGRCADTWPAVLATTRIQGGQQSHTGGAVQGLGYTFSILLRLAVRNPSLSLGCSVKFVTPCHPARYPDAIPCLCKVAHLDKEDRCQSSMVQDLPGEGQTIYPRYTLYIHDLGGGDSKHPEEVDTEKAWSVQAPPCLHTKRCAIQHPPASPFSRCITLPGVQRGRWGCRCPAHSPTPCMQGVMQGELDDHGVRGTQRRARLALMHVHELFQTHPLPNSRSVLNKRHAPGLALLGTPRPAHTAWRGPC